MHVIKIGGAVCQDPASISQLADLPRPCIIVHGGGPQLNDALATLGEPERIEGLRVTPPAAATAVAATLDNVGADIAARLNALGVNARQVPSRAKALVADVADPRLGRVGTVSAVREHLLEPADDEILVVTPLGWDGHGPLNINADAAAAAVATSVRAKVMVLVTDVDGVLSGTGDVVVDLDPTTAAALITEGVARGGMIPKLRSASRAASSGVDQVRIGRIGCAFDPRQGTVLVC